MKGQWTKVYSGDLPLRSWWVDSGSDCEYISIVLPEVFGINHWIRNFSEKLAKQNIPVLALPLYGRTAPKLDLSCTGIKSSEEPHMKFNFPETFSSNSIGAKLVSVLGAVTPAP